LFVAVQLGLALAIRPWLPWIERPVFSERLSQLQRVRLDAAGTQRPLVLMLGSSRTLFGLDARTLAASLGGDATVFNFGTLGAGPVTEFLYLRRLLEAGIEPDLLLVEVLPPYLAGQTAQPPEARWFPRDGRLGARELALLRSFRFPMQPLEKCRWQSQLLPVGAHRRGLREWLAPWSLPRERRNDWLRETDDFGWLAQREPVAFPQRQQLMAADRQQYVEPMRDLRPGGAAGRALRLLLETCRSRQIPAALVLLPESDEFRRWYTQDGEARVDAYLHEVTRVAPVPLIDGRHWVQDDGFFDAHHLSAIGAGRFSTVLGAELRRLRSSPSALRPGS